MLIKRFMISCCVLILCLTGCTVHINKPESTTKEIQPRAAVETEEPEATTDMEDSGPDLTVNRNDNNTVKQVNPTPDISISGDVEQAIASWHPELMDSHVAEFFDKLKAFQLKFADADAVLLTDYELDKPSEEVTLQEALDAFMLLKYSVEWGDEIKETSIIKWEDADDLAKLFGFESSQMASDMYEVLGWQTSETEVLPKASLHNNYSYLGDWVPGLNMYDFSDGTETDTIYVEETSVEDTPACITTDGTRSAIYVPLVGTSSVEYNKNVYWILVPNANASYEDDVRFDTHDDVTIYSDWSIFIDQMTDGMVHVCDLDGYKFKRDRGIVIVSDEWLASADESDLQEIVEYTRQYVNTDYSSELLEFPKAGELAEYDKPYDLWYDYFGLKGMFEGANLERLTGDYSYWETHEIGGERISE